MSSDHEKRNLDQSSLKDEIIGLIKHDEVDALIQRFLTHAKKIHRTKVIINSIVILLGFLIGIGAFYLAYQASADETLIATKKAYDQERSLNIQENIRRKIQWMRKLDSAVINLRIVRDHIVLQCKYNQPISAYRQELLRDNARFVIINAFTGSNFVFNDALYQQAPALIAFDESVKDVCAANAPHDIKWREHLIAINNIMGQSIRKDQEMLNNLDK